MFNAFISYSHAVDGKLAPAIQRGLHRMAKPWYKMRALRIFRDETNLTASPNLWGSIEDNLSQSNYFIYMASPEAANSKWVKKEISFWLDNKSIDHLLIVLTNGEIHWNMNDFDWDKTTTLPKIDRVIYFRGPNALRSPYAFKEHIK